jgi:aryl-alcohol dehydrogenase-like predicted oxidoreductase
MTRSASIPGAATAGLGIDAATAGLGIGAAGARLGVGAAPAGTHLGIGAAGTRLGIGTAALAVPYGAPGAERPPPERSAARRTLLYALERGLRFIDTAPAYGEAEALVGEALGGREDCGDCIVATKLAIPPAGWAALSPRETHAHVRASAHASLRVLRRERLEVLQIHNAQPAQAGAGPLMEALAELRAEGLVGSVGATVYGEASALAAIASPDVEVVQIAYSALDRRPERRVLPAAAAEKETVVARSLLLHGVLSPAGRDLRGPFAALGAATDALRQALGVSWEELPGAAVAFVASRPGIDCALLGPREEAELAALLDQAERFAATAASWNPAAPELSGWLLDPSRWPAEVTVGG